MRRALLRLRHQTHPLCGLLLCPPRIGGLEDAALRGEQHHSPHTHWSESNGGRRGCQIESGRVAVSGKSCEVNSCSQIGQTLHEEQIPGLQVRDTGLFRGENLSKLGFFCPSFQSRPWWDGDPAALHLWSHFRFATWSQFQVLSVKGSCCPNLKLKLILCFLSGSQVVLAADMLGLDGLKDVVEMVLTRDYCRFFPKVNTGVILSVCLSVCLSICPIDLQVFNE